VRKDEKMGFRRRNPSAVYEIRVQGELGQEWQEWFSGLTVISTQVSGEPATTTLAGPVADQAALRGILGKLWDLNLTLISLRRIEGAGSKEALNV
jgi:hypothetical protein